MRGLWWKIGSAILVIYSVFLGLLAPLNPGIKTVDPDQLNNGGTTVIITGYNSHFADAAQSQQVWLTNGDEIFCAYEYQVVDNTHIRVTFSIYQDIREAFFDLYVHNAVDGTMHLPDAFLQNAMEVSLKPDKIEPCLTALAEADRGFGFPNQPILNETIRNLLFHVPSWFAMILIMAVSFGYSIVHLRHSRLDADAAAANAARVGLLFAFIGLATGMIWARFTWGAWWVNDRRLNGAAVATLIYLAYFVLRSSVNEEQKAARLAGVYNIFAFVMMLLFVMVWPRLGADSLHPGVGGNPAFNQYDLDDNLRLVFYPAVLGWMGISLWIFQLQNRMDKLRRIADEH